jgi:hypothetical protein
MAEAPSIGTTSTWSLRCRSTGRVSYAGLCSDSCRVRGLVRRDIRIRPKCHTFVRRRLYRSHFTWRRRRCHCSLDRGRHRAAATRAGGARSAGHPEAFRQLRQGHGFQAGCGRNRWPGRPRVFPHHLRCDVRSARRYRCDDRQGKGIACLAQAVRGDVARCEGSLEFGPSPTEVSSSSRATVF